MDRPEQNLLEITFSKLYQLKKGKWQFVSYLCHGCGRGYPEKALETHPDKCPRVNRLYKKDKKDANSQD